MYNGHYRMAWFYAEGVDAMANQELAFRTAEGKVAKVDKNLEVWRKPKRWDNWMLYVRRSGIPDIRAREVMFYVLPPGVEEQSIGADTSKFGTGVGALGLKAYMEVRKCLVQIAECSEIYGIEGEPWFPRDMIGKLEDEDFSSFWLDSTEEPR